MKMDPERTKQIIAELPECVGTYIIWSEESIRACLQSIKWLNDVPGSVSSIVAEFASEIDKSDEDGCSMCCETFYETFEHMHDMQQNPCFVTWFKIICTAAFDKKQWCVNFICENCIEEEVADACWECKTISMECQFRCRKCGQALCSDCDDRNEICYKCRNAAPRQHRITDADIIETVARSEKLQKQYKEKMLVKWETRRHLDDLMMKRKENVISNAD